MKKYVGTKLIGAKPMTRGEYNEYRGWSIPKNENPEDLGYLVKYSDDYESWSPKEVFDESYREYDEDKLPHTALGMISEDYKERFKAEYKQLEIRITGLKKMLLAWDNGTLSFEPSCPRSTYDLQLSGMVMYLSTLEARAKMEGIEI